jgi:hypothetical protein
VHTHGIEVIQVNIKKCSGKWINTIHDQRQKRKGIKDRKFEIIKKNIVHSKKTEKKTKNMAHIKNKESFYFVTLA